MDKQEFFTLAVQRETTAEHAYRRLAEMVIAEGRLDAMEFFHQMAEYARLHRESMLEQAQMSHITLLLADFSPHLPPGEIPPQLTRDDIPHELAAAMELALSCEQDGLAFYESVAKSSGDAETCQLAEAFAAEERQHVAALQRFMGLRPY